MTSVRRSGDTAAPLRRMPLYAQAEKVLEDLLVHRRYRVGDRIPPEVELVRSLGVSRATIRAGVGRLVDRGLLIRRQGSGTYLAQIPERRDQPSPVGIKLGSSVAQVGRLRAVSDYEVVLVRHGETHGYDRDGGLTDRGRQQAHERGSALAAELAPGATVRMPHARTARARETAAVMRAALVADRAAGRSLDLGPTYAEPWLDNLRVSVDGVGVEAGTAVGDRLALDGELPGWAVECDRFDRGYGPSKAAGGPIQYWLRNPMLYFEPPQVAAYRVWRGIISAGASAPGRLVVIASTHSAPMRAFAATAFGRDLGEPDHLEGVRVLVHGDHAAATIRYRDLEIEVAPPAQLPPWIDREWLEPSSDR